jgi:hypothetical protein
MDDQINPLVKRDAAPVALQSAINDAQRAILTQRTPPNIIKKRPGKGGKTFSYVEHAWVTEQLNLAFGWAWDWEIVEWQVINDVEVMVLGRLTVTTQEGHKITKMQFGSSDIKKDSKGKVLSVADDLKAASSDGLKKAASLLGLALDLYSDDIGRYDPEPEPAAAWVYTCDTCGAEVATAAAMKVSEATGGLVLCKRDYVAWIEQREQEAAQ